MPFLIQVGAQVMCAHGGQAQATVPYPRVLLGGQPAVQQAAALGDRGVRLPAAAGR